VRARFTLVVSILAGLEFPVTALKLRTRFKLAILGRIATDKGAIGTLIRVTLITINDGAGAAALQHSFGGIAITHPKQQQ
jgi:hypothetical protein